MQVKYACSLYIMIIIAVFDRTASNFFSTNIQNFVKRQREEGNNLKTQLLCINFKYFRLIRLVIYNCCYTEELQN